MVPLFGGAAAPSPTGELQQAVEKFLGKKLRITWVANADYNTKTNALLASDNLPDVVTIQDNKAPAFVKAAEAGAFWDLTGKLDKYPNLKPASAQTALNASVNGKTYGIYRVRPLLRSAVLIRKDWLDKLGLQLPKTTDDLYNVAKAFTEKDPDGNGKKDTYGLILPKWPGVTFAASSPYNAVDVWFGAPNNWGKRDGKLVPEFDTPEFMQANNYLKKLIDEGLTNPDWATLDTGKWNDPFVLGKGGIIIDVNVRATDLFKRFRELDPEHYTDKVAMTGNLTGPGGVKHSLPFTGYNGILAISKQRVRTEQQLDDLLKVMDKLASKEGSVLTTNGLEGRNIKVAGGFAEPVNQDDAKVKTIQSDVDNAFVQLGTRYTVGLGVYPAKPPSQAEQDNLKLRDELMNEDLKTAVIDPSLPVIAPTQVSKGATLNPIVLDARMNYLAGKLTEDQLKAEVKRWYDGGGTQIAAEIGQQLSKMGQ
ncbi:MAG: extracellular solute-binding protein [Nonomuraea sp.]|nr:extracellular solute-binding protein [Nonomuraea sp.]